MEWKKIVIDYFTFTRKERVGIITVLLITAGVIFLPAFFSHHNNGTNRETPDTTWMTAIKKLEQKEAENEKYIPSDNENNPDTYQYDPPKNNYYNRPEGELFYFDPNILSTNGWQKLGLKKKTIQTIQNYLSKGGHFKKAEDLQRVYGLHKEDYERLAPYVKIKNEFAENRNNNDVDESKNPQEKKAGFRETLKYSSIDINTADTSAFINLPGIGSKLATRIVNFREKLGGFYATEQVRETFGLPDSTFQKIKGYLELKNVTVKKINVNTATVDELKVHPYIKWNIANSIIAYRKEHNLFSNIEDIKKIMIITDDIYRKIAPYLTIQ